MEWTRTAISRADPCLAGGAPAAPDGIELHARPRQPARPDLGVRDVGRARPSGSVGDLDRARPARAHARPDRVHRWSTDGCARSPRAPATPWRWAKAGRSSTPASVGQPRDGDPRASYLILDLDGRNGHVGSRRLRLRSGRRPDARGRSARRRLAERLRVARSLDSDRRKTTASRPQTRGPARPGRASARPVLPVHGPQPAGGQAGGECRSDARRTPARSRPRGRLRPPAVDRGGDRRASQQDEGAGDLQLGRDQLVGLCDRGDPAGPRCWPAPARCSCRSRSRSRSPSCWRSSRSPIARSVGPIRAAAARTSWRKTNLAPIFGLIAAAALLIDYVMTVAVSTAAAIAQIQSVIPAAYDFRIWIAFVSISLITIANLRGLRESGNIFAVPTYLFVGLALTIVAIGLVNIIGGTVVRSPPSPMRSRSPRGPPRADRHPAPAQGLRRRVGRADRRRGDRQRRPGVQAAGGRRTRPTR